MDVNLQWNPPFGVTGSHLTLGIPDFVGSSKGYSYGIAVTQTGLNAFGQVIATKLAFSYRFAASS